MISSKLRKKVEQRADFVLQPPIANFRNFCTKNARKNCWLTKIASKSSFITKLEKCPLNFWTRKAKAKIRIKMKNPIGNFHLMLNDLFNLEMKFPMNVANIWRENRSFCREAFEVIITHRWAKWEKKICKITKAKIMRQKTENQNWSKFSIKIKNILILMVLIFSAKKELFTDKVNNKDSVVYEDNLQCKFNPRNYKILYVINSENCFYRKLALTRAKNVSLDWWKMTPKI